VSLCVRITRIQSDDLVQPSRQSRQSDSDLSLTSLAACMLNDVHRVREKKRPQFFRHNFDKFSRSFVIFGTNRPDTSLY